MFLKDYQLSFEDIEKNKTLSALVFAVNNGFPLHDLTPYHRRQVVNFMQNKKPIDIDFHCFGLVLGRYLTYYFPFIYP